MENNILNTDKLKFKIVYHNSIDLFYISVLNSPYVLRRDLTLSSNTEVENYDINNIEPQERELLKELIKHENLFSGWFANRKSAKKTIKEAKSFRRLDVIENWKYK